MHALADSEQERRSAKAIITNLMNRLIVMMEEELLFADWARFLRCRQWLSEFDAGGRSEFALLIKVCRVMCEGELLRLNSDIRRYWGERSRQRDGESIASCPRGDIDGIIKPADAGWTGRTGTDVAAAFAGCLRERDPRAYKWALAMMRVKGSGARRWRRTEPVWAAWEIIMREAEGGPPALLECLELKRIEFQKRNRPERHMWLSAAVSLVLHSEKIDWTVSRSGIDLEVTGEEADEVLWERERLELDSYVLDQHCQAGRALGRGSHHFRQHGSLVVDENREYFVREWRYPPRRRRLSCPGASGRPCPQ